MLWSTSGNKCRKVVDKSTPPPKESKVMTILFLDFREPASSADIQLNFLARKNGTRPHIMQAQNRTTIDTPLATRTPSVSVAFPPPPPCSASKSAIFFWWYFPRVWRRMGENTGTSSFIQMPVSAICACGGSERRACTMPCHRHRRSSVRSTPAQPLHTKQQNKAFQRVALNTLIEILPLYIYN